MAAFQGSPAESHRVESRDQAPPPPLSTRLAGMSMQHAFLAQELEDFDNAAAATPTTQPSATPYAAAMHQMPPPGFGPGFYAPSPMAQAAKPNADAAAAAVAEVGVLGVGPVEAALAVGELLDAKHGHVDLGDLLELDAVVAALRVDVAPFDLTTVLAHGERTRASGLCRRVWPV